APGFDGLPKPTEETVASLIYTSGTTGVPKGVILTHGNFAADTEAAVVPVHFCKEDNFLAVLPFFHTYSFTGNVLLPLCQGGCVSFIRSIRTIGEDMKALKPTILMAVPLLAEKIYAKVEKGVKANPLARLLVALGLGRLVGRQVVKSLGGALRFIAVGGAPADARVIRGLCRLGIATLEGYGLTECAPLVCYPTLEHYTVGTVGKVLPCMDFKLADPDDTGAGELCVRGPNVMTGYYNDPEATAAAFDGDGYLRTGDLARLDAEGNVVICGRRKAMIVNREGKNIYPEEIEQLVNRSPLVAESLALGYKVGDETGERVGLIVQADDEACVKSGQPKSRWDALVSRELERICKLGLAAYKIPRKIVVRHLPFELTSTMKVRRVKYDGALDEK
ncbi:MAG: AMP-binding protein, partial [Kiritimatiellae bacterium]|nr:AMP-binding protein [Kiritimatiellia bacterium]